MSDDSAFALLAAATLMGLSLLQLGPPGGTALALSGARLAIGVAGCVAILAWLFGHSASIMIPLVLAFVTGVVFYPLVERMTRVHVPRWLGALVRRQDGATFRPMPATCALGPDAGTLVGRANFRLADGTRMSGYLTPPADAEPGLGSPARASASPDRHAALLRRLGRGLRLAGVHQTVAAEPLYQLVHDLVE